MNPAPHRIPYLEIKSFTFSRFQSDIKNNLERRGAG